MENRKEGKKGRKAINNLISFSRRENPPGLRRRREDKTEGREKKGRTEERKNGRTEVRRNKRTEGRAEGRKERTGRKEGGDEGMQA